MFKYLLLIVCLVSCQSKVNISEYETNKIKVRIDGEINKPGIYELPIKATLSQLIEKAGGLSENADEKSFDQNLILKHNDTITIYDQSNSKIDLNSATLEQLMTIKGIGKTTARKIIEYRTNEGRFSSIDQLIKIRGISEKKLEQIKPLLKLK